jgi:hypothetical protein
MSLVKTLRYFSLSRILVLIMASGDAVQQIKDRLNIIDVISPYAELSNEPCFVSCKR